ncbi:MAG: TolC family protein [Desulfobacterales bacterium]|jgi:outer membrane protein
MAAGAYRCRSAAFLVSGLWLVLASCGMLQQGIDRAAGGPSVPADTSIYMKLESLEPSETTAPQVVSPGPMRITIVEAILLALENNRTLVVERLNPAIEKTFEEEERAIFDPETNAEISAGRVDGKRQTNSGDQIESFSTDTVDGVISLEQFFPTGTTVSVEGSTLMTDSLVYENKFYSTRLGMTVNQALLRGFGTDVNLARLRQARLDTRLSEYELRGFTQSLVADVERTYWDYALARRQIEIVEESLKVARQQLSETQELIAVGRLAEAELPAVQAEVAAQEQALINARSNMESMRLRLLRLLNPPGPGLWKRQVDLIHQPTLPEIKLDDIEQYVAVSLRMRPVLNEARLGVLRDDLELVRTKNGLLPLMDLFVNLGKSGYADSFHDSVSNLNGDNYDILGGMRFEYPFWNREAKARHQRAQLSREQSEKALENLSQLVEVDVRTAYIEVNRSKQQIAASSATRRFDEEKLRIETEKFRVGRSTSFLVAQAQRDLLVSRIAEVQALANYLKALVDLYEQDGSLLERRGISAPGREPIRLPK